MTLSTHPDAIQALLAGEMGAPSSLLGRHQLEDLGFDPNLSPLGKAH